MSYIIEMNQKDHEKDHTVYIAQVTSTPAISLKQRVVKINRKEREEMSFKSEECA